MDSGDYLEKARILDSVITHIHCFSPDDRTMKIRYTLRATKPWSAHYYWEFDESRIFKNHADALAYVNKKRREYYESELRKVREQAEEWEAKIKGL
jgi:hypothetical protein